MTEAAHSEEATTLNDTSSTNVGMRILEVCSDRASHLEESEGPSRVAVLLTILVSKNS